LLLPPSWVQVFPSPSCSDTSYLYSFGKQKSHTLILKIFDSKQ
jgi:hypothetical protein